MSQISRKFPSFRKIAYFSVFSRSRKCVLSQINQIPTNFFSIRSLCSKITSSNNIQATTLSSVDEEADKEGEEEGAENEGPYDNKDVKKFAKDNIIYRDFYVPG